MGKPVVCGLSGSPREGSFTDKMLDLCTEGMGDVEVRKFYVHKMDINPCKGCLACWRKNDGVCVQQDDFTQIIEAYRQCQYILMAAPVYVWGFPGPVKTLIDRFIVAVERWLEESPDGKTVHPIRWDHHPKAVFISSCGFPEMDNFRLMREHFKTMAKAIGWQWSGEILIPGAAGHVVPGAFDKKYELIKQAGRELVEGTISEETTQQIAEPIMDVEDFRKMVNAFFRGGLRGKAQMTAIAMKAVRRQRRAGK